jgi:hypothetical protein
MDGEPDDGYAHVGAAKVKLLAWAESNGLPLVRMHCVGPFHQPDFSLGVWLFYGTDLDVERCTSDGRTALMQGEFLSILSEAGYSAERLAEVIFVVDSHENVERNYEGSYFYRLR